MEFFLNVISKNDAGWLQCIDSNSGSVCADSGYAPIPAGAGTIAKLVMTDENANHEILCKVGLWREANGTGAPSRGGWEVCFKFTCSDNGVVRDITPEYNAHALNYFDQGEILFNVNGSNLKHLLSINQIRYNNWLSTTGRKV